MLATEPFEVDDFSGGITDNYLAAPPNKYQRANNLVLTPYGEIAKLKSRDGSIVFDIDNPILDVSNLRRTAGLEFFQGELIAFQKHQLFYRDSNNSNAWTELQGPTSESLFPSATSVDVSIIRSRWQNQMFITNDEYHYPSKIYKDGSGDWQLRTAGLPNLASAPTVTAGAAGSGVYTYRFCYEYTYTVGTVEFVDRGAITEVQVSSAAAPNSNAIAISSIPVLSNATPDTNWDTANIKVEIYRTTDGGQTYFYVGEVTNGTTTFNDSVSDTNLQLNPPLYTNGGVVDNDPVPLAKLVHIVRDTGTAYYADIKEGTKERKNVLRQSLRGDPDSCPLDFELEVADDIIGLSSYRGIPILLGSRSVIRVDGSFDRFGRGGMVPEEINDEASCVSAKSVVQTLKGLFWAGEDGFYWTNGYQVVRLTQNDLSTSYARIVSDAAKRKRIEGHYDRVNQRVWWTVTEDAASGDNDYCWILNLDFLNMGTNPPNAPFTKATGASFKPSALTFHEGVMYRGDSNGYIFQHETQYETDPLVDTSITAANWGEETIIFDYISAGFNMGAGRVRKAAPKIGVICRNETNLALQIISINDDGRVVENLKPVQFTGLVEWGDSQVEWGDPSVIWNFQGVIEQLRRFPRKSYRFTYKQIQLTNALVAITNSDRLGKVTVDSAQEEISLVNADTEFPELSVGYVIALENDGYSKEYDILSMNGTSDVLTVDDSETQLPTSTVEEFQWVIRGKPKNFGLDLISFAIDFSSITLEKGFYRREQDGEVSS